VKTNNCPQCQEELLLKAEELEIPYFGRVLILTLSCPGCRYHYSDTFILDEHSPTRYALTIEGEEDLDARVVRSSSGTIKLPELGVVVEPGPACEAFISNIEGVLERVKDVLEMATGFGEREAVRARELLEKIEKIKKGEERVTVIIDDPQGNSAIISQKAKKEELTPEEASKLKRGMITIEVGENSYS